jgi:hypothetical protein
MLNAREEVLFVFDVVNLVEFNNFSLAKNFYGKRLFLKCGQVDLTKSSCSNNLNKIVVFYFTTWVVNLSL